MLPTKAGSARSRSYPVPIKVYDETIRVLKSAVRKARLGRDEELGALQRLDAQARSLECVATGPSVEQRITDEILKFAFLRWPFDFRL